jgi:hypothetical protein
MMTPMAITATGRLVLLMLAVALAFSVMGCANGPLGSHGVEYIPAFDNPPPDE